MLFRSIQALESQKFPANLIDSLRNKPKLTTFVRPKADFYDMLRRVIGKANADQYFDQVFKQAQVIPPYRIDGIDLYYRQFGNAETESQIKLVDVVHSISTAKDIKVSGNRITYYNLNEQPRATTVSELINTFKTENLEYRSYLLGTDHTGRDMLRDRKSTRLNSSH